MRRLYFSLGKNKFWEYVLLALFLLFFYGPLMNMLLLSFAGDYEYPDVIPRSYGFKWWDYVLSKAQLVQSIWPYACPPPTHWHATRSGAAAPCA